VATTWEESYDPDMRSMCDTPHDVQILREALKQLEVPATTGPVRALCSRRESGRRSETGAMDIAAHKRRVSRCLRRELRQRGAPEPDIGRMTTGQGIAGCTARIFRETSPNPSSVAAGRKAVCVRASVAAMCAEPYAGSKPAKGTRRYAEQPTRTGAICIDEQGDRKFVQTFRSDLHGEERFNCIIRKSQISSAGLYAGGGLREQILARRD